MTIPGVAFLEMALDQIARADPPTLLAYDAELKELHMLGDARLETYAASLPPSLTDLERGYLLGVEVARVLLAGMPAAVLAGVTL